MYEPDLDSVEGLAAEFLASPGWKQAASSDARKKAAEPRADGFCPPPLIRNELYVRTRDLFKDRGSSGLFLSVRSAHPQRSSGTVRDAPAAGALNVGSYEHYILRGLYGALILGAGRVIAV